MPEPKEEGFAGIDPDALDAMNSDLAKTQAMLDALLPKLRSAYTTVNLDTGAIDRLRTVSSWIATELPMLRRRHVMAQQLMGQALQLGQNPVMVPTEWAGNFTSTAAAIGRAKELAAQYQEPGRLPAAVWDELAANQHDPDFAAAFAKALGPHATRLVVAGLGKDKLKADRLPALANLFATASSRRVFDDTWFTGFPGVPGILPLLQFGKWDNDLLVHVGNLALAPDRRGIDNERTAQVLAAVARSPIAATRLYEENFATIQAMSRGLSPGWVNGARSQLGDPLGTFIRAATIDARAMYDNTRPAGTTTWANPAEALTRRLLLDLRDNPHRARFAGVQSAYAAIATEYFDDLEAVASGPPVPEYYDQPDPARPGIEAPATAWAALIQQAMRDPKSAGYLSTLFRARYEAKSAAVTAGETKFKDANNFSNWQNGRFRSWFLDQLNTTQSAANKEAADYNANVKQWVDYFVDPASAALFAEGGPAGAAAAKTITGFVKASGKGSVSAMIVGWLDRTPQQIAADSVWAGDNKVWQTKARNSLAAGITPVRDAHGTTWTGDPTGYEKKYGAKFTTGNPEDPLRPVAEMSQAARRAYAAWMEDPAVQQAAWDDFNADVLGSRGR
ncbi:hypothetical protein GCM10009804_68090 [Kribbella hippodromi]|uniref:Uncharacterized protein n=1 Tax=Kribbella hippodromi TaxID=434347 RepID=A0ABN2EAY9_9ACTN